MERPRFLQPPQLDRPTPRGRRGPSGRVPRRL